MIAFTDARIEEGKSTHSFWIKTHQGKTLYEKRFDGFDTRPTEGELHTIIKLLQFVDERSMKKMRIYTDCKSIVDSLASEEGFENLNVSYLRHLLKVTKSKIIWKERKFNKRCDKNCRLTKYQFHEKKGRFKTRLYN